VFGGVPANCRNFSFGDGGWLKPVQVQDLRPKDLNSDSEGDDRRGTRRAHLLTRGDVSLRTGHLELPSLRPSTRLPSRRRSHGEYHHLERFDY